MWIIPPTLKRYYAAVETQTEPNWAVPCRAEPCWTVPSRVIPRSGKAPYDAIWAPSSWEWKEVSVNFSSVWPGPATVHPGFQVHCKASVNFVRRRRKIFVNEPFLLWLRRDVDKLKLISDDKNDDEIYAASSLTRRDGTKMLFEDYRTFKIHPLG